MNDFIDRKIMESIVPNQPEKETTFFSSVPKLISELSQEKNNVAWVLEGYLAKGHVTVLSALPKAGKTTWNAHLLKSLERGVFIGKETTPTKVLVISEESEALWFRRSKEFSLTSDIWIWSNPVKQKLSNHEWNIFLKFIADFSVKNGIGLVIIDTLSSFWSVWKENDAADVQNALLPLNYLKTQNIAVLLIHHVRKSGGDEGVGARGSGALGAFVDIIVEFKRMESTNPGNTARILHAWSRFEETPHELVIELIDGEYLPRGTSHDVSRQKRLKAVVQILSENEDKSLTLQEIHQIWDEDEYGTKPSKKSIGNYIDYLQEEGIVCKDGSKKVGKTNASIYTTTDNLSKRAIISIEGNTGQQNVSSEANNARKESGHIDSEGVIREEPNKCRICGGEDFWTRPVDGGLVCNKCHPQVSNKGGSS